MSSNILKEAAATAIVLLSLNGVPQAQDNSCTAATLKGSYGTSVHAVSLGILTPDQVLHPYATPVMINAVALPTFFGNGQSVR